MNKCILLLASAVLVSACATTAPPTQLYLLGDAASVAAPNVASAAPDGVPNVVLAQVDTAGFLNVAGIVYQTAPNEINVAARNLWAEPLPDQLRRTFYDALATQVKTVAVYPGLRSAPVRSVRLRVNFSGFHGRYDGKAVVAGVWSLADTQNEPLLRQPFKYEIALQSDGYSELVAALESGLQASARDIAASLDRYAGANAQE